MTAVVREQFDRVVRFVFFDPLSFYVRCAGTQMVSPRDCRLTGRSFLLFELILTNPTRIRTGS
jgi:hypothetical protein